MTSFFKGCYDTLLSVATSPCTFGEGVEYRPLSGGRYNVKAVFDQNFEQIDPDTEATVSVQQPRIEVKLDDIPVEPRAGDKVRLYNSDSKVFENYEVTEIQEDGIGGAVLFFKILEDD